jgi:hypothetical protein
VNVAERAGAKASRSWLKEFMTLNLSGGGRIAAIFTFSGARKIRRTTGRERGSVLVARFVTAAI